MPHSPPLIKPNQAKSPFFAGVDLGGTSVKLGVVDEQGRSLSRLSIPTLVRDGPAAAVARIAEALRRGTREAGLEWSDIAQVGLGAPGTLDQAQGLLLEPCNLPGWWGFPIRDRLSEQCGKPVAFGNDASAAAYGEFWVGSGKSFHSMALFTLGTGVGGGIMIGDLAIDGENSAGSELGHVIIDYNDSARMCSCGKRGHLEAYASASSLVRRTEEALASGRSSTLAARVAAGETLTPILIAEEADRSDALAREIILDTARFLAVGMVTVMHTIDPNGVLVGGAMTFGQHDTNLGRTFLQTIRAEVRERAFPVLAERITIDYAALGGDAGYIGAAGMARIAHRKRKSPN